MKPACLPPPSGPRQENTDGILRPVVEVGGECDVDRPTELPARGKEMRIVPERRASIGIAPHPDAAFVVETRAEARRSTKAKARPLLETEELDATDDSSVD